MSHWIIAPVVLPAMMAPLIGYVMRHDIVLARVASAASGGAAEASRASFWSSRAPFWSYF